MSISVNDRNLFSVGVFLIFIVVGILLATSGVITWFLCVPLILLLSGFWMLVLAGMRAIKPQKYERSTLSTLALGLGMIVIGGAWVVSIYSWIYSLAVILLAIALLAILAALKFK
jgi:hypothetical protein